MKRKLIFGLLVWEATILLAAGTLHPTKLPQPQAQAQRR
jgi:hypothetical protein